MVYLIGVVGFICGFVGGQLLLMLYLRDYSNEEIIEMMRDKSLKMKYGLLNWLLAMLGAISFVMVYNRYF